MLSLLLCSSRPRAGDVDTLLFGSLDAGSPTFLSAGAKFAFGPPDRDGFVVLTSVGAGRQKERGVDGLRTRYSAGAAAVMGYQWFFDWGVVAAYAGPEGDAEMLVDARAAVPAPVRFGARLHGEIWARPSEGTLLQGTAIAGSIRNSLWTRLAWGYRLWDTYLGPEACLYADETGYRKTSLGLHATDFDIGRYTLRLSAGLQSELGRRGTAPYVSLAIWSPW